MPELSQMKRPRTVHMDLRLSSNQSHVVSTKDKAYMCGPRWSNWPFRGASDWPNEGGSLHRNSGVLLLLLLLLLFLLTPLLQGGGPGRYIVAHSAHLAFI